MNAIKGFTSLVLRREPSLTGRGKQNLEKVGQASDHLLAMINDLLDLSKIEAGRMELSEQNLAVEPLVERVRAVVTGMASERGIEIVTRGAQALPAVRADESKLRQILFNLLSNAVKFSNDGQVVELESRFRAAVESPLHVDSVEIAVIDHGIGIKDEERSLLFDEFRQAEGGAVRGGTGLGLAIVRRLAELQGGVVTFDSISGAGSTFRVVLPAAPHGRVEAQMAGDSRRS